MTNIVLRWHWLNTPQPWGPMLGVALLLCCISRSVAAQPSTPASHRDQARQLALEGADAFVAKDFSKALDRFQRAGKLYEAPTITVMEARTLVELGHLLEASNKFRLTEQTTLRPSATHAFREAVKDAALEGAQVRGRLAHINVQCVAAPLGLTIYLDGERMQLEQQAFSSVLNPGEHVVRAIAPGHVEFERTLLLSERQVEAIEIKLAPIALSIRRPVAQPKAVKPHRIVPRESTPTLGIAGLVAGGAVTVVAGIFFSVAWREKEALEGRCSPSCPAEAQGDIDRFRLHRTIAFTSLGAGAIVAGVGGYLIWGRKSESPRVALSLGPEHVALKGSF